MNSGDFFQFKVIMKFNEIALRIETGCRLTIFEAIITWTLKPLSGSVGN